MTLPQVYRILAHWKRNPPLRALVTACAAALGVQFPNPEEDNKPKTYMSANQARAWAAAANRAVTNPNG
jgi:hypothetical protein